MFTPLSAADPGRFPTSPRPPRRIPCRPRPDEYTPGPPAPPMIRPGPLPPDGGKDGVPDPDTPIAVLWSSASICLPNSIICGWRQRFRATEDREKVVVSSTLLPEKVRAGTRRVKRDHQRLCVGSRRDSRREPQREWSQGKRKGFSASWALPRKT